MNFIDKIENEMKIEKSRTWNGAVAYKTSGNALLDFSFETAALRQADPAEIAKRWTNVYFEDPLTAMKYLFWLRDCRGGNGERRIFRVILRWLAFNKPAVFNQVLGLVPEFGRYDDILSLLDGELPYEAFVKVIITVSRQLSKDVEALKEGKPVSLLAKWLPSESTSSQITRERACKLIAALKMSARSYRKIVTKLRRATNVVEQKMSAREWDEIDYAAVPSQANLKYMNAFLRQDEERRKAYLESLKKGETKINAGTLQPHEIVKEYRPGQYRSKVDEYNESLEQLWKALPNVAVDNALVVQDSSGSMTWGSGSVTPIHVATALAIYIAEHNTGIWKGKYLTFSDNPKLIDLTNCKTLRDKLLKVYSICEYANTDIKKTMDLILRTAVKNHCPPEEMPKRAILISDMQFDAACQGRPDESLFDGIAREFEDAGYKMPQICFWNVNLISTGTIPMQQNELGVVLAGGYSPQIMKMFMSGETDPYKALLSVINTERYKPVEDALAGIEM